MYLEVFKGREALFGSNDPDTIDAKYKYACTLKNLRRFKEAEKIFLEVIKGSEVLFGSNHSGTLDAKYNYAVILDKLKR